MGRPAVDMTGETYGELTVLVRHDLPGKVAQWECVCVCGRHIIVRRDHLVSGNTKSCGKCGAFHAQELTVENAAYLVDTHVGPRYMRDMRYAFGVPYVRETGAVAAMPRKPTGIANPFGSGMKRLVEAGLIPAMALQPSKLRWAKECRVLPGRRFTYDSVAALVAAWEEITGEEHPDGEAASTRAALARQARQRTAAIYARTPEEMAETRRKVRAAFLGEEDAT